MMARSFAKADVFDVLELAHRFFIIVLHVFPPQGCGVERIFRAVEFDGIPAVVSALDQRAKDGHKVRDAMPNDRAAQKVALFAQIPAAAGELSSAVFAQIILDVYMAYVAQEMRGKARGFLAIEVNIAKIGDCLLYTSPSPRD